MPIIRTIYALWVNDRIINIPAGYRRLNVGEIIPQNAYFWDVYYDGVLNDTTNFMLWKWYDPSKYTWSDYNDQGGQIIIKDVAAFIVKNTTPKGNKLRSIE